MSEVKDDEYEIIVDEAPAKDAEIEVEASGKTDEQQDWKAQFEAAQKRADDAEAKRAEVEKQRNADAERHAAEQAQSRQSTVSAEMAAVNNALANTEHARVGAKQAYVTALQNGDYDAAADAQSQMAEIAVRQQRIKEGKAAIERRAEMAKEASDPVEQWASRVTPRSAQWIRSHPETVRTPEAQRKLEQAHYLALGNGHPADTDGYFTFLEKEIAQRDSATADTTASVTEARTQEREQPAPAAPPSRETPSAGSGSTPTRIRLTAAQRDVAAACGMTDAEYAKHLVALQRDGSISTH